MKAYNLSVTVRMSGPTLQLPEHLEYKTVRRLSTEHCNESALSVGDSFVGMVRSQRRREEWKPVAASLTEAGQQRENARNLKCISPMGGSSGSS